VGTDEGKTRKLLSGRGCGLAGVIHYSCG